MARKFHKQKYLEVPASLPNHCNIAPTEAFLLFH